MKAGSRLFIPFSWLTLLTLLTHRACNASGQHVSKLDLPPTRQGGPHHILEGDHLSKQQHREGLNILRAATLTH